MSFKVVVEENYQYWGHGFPVEIDRIDARTNGEDTIVLLDHNALQRKLLEALAWKPSRLTGAEVRFIRKSDEKTLQAFADQFNLTHPVIHQWEQKGQEPTGMEYQNELLLRLHVLCARLETPECAPRLFTFDFNAKRPAMTHKIKGEDVAFPGGLVNTGKKPGRISKGQYWTASPVRHDGQVIQHTKGNPTGDKVDDVTSAA